MPDTHLILHIKGTESQTAALLREEVLAAVWQGKLTQSQLIWRPSENTWKPVRELPELIPPVERLILHVKGTESETRELPRPAVREGISKGSITHSQLIWRPSENAWKQVRELPELLPSQRIAPAPRPAPVVTVEEIIPDTPASPVARAIAAAGAPPRVKMPGTSAVPQARVAVPVATAVPQARVATPAAVPQVRVAVAPEAVPHVRAVATPVAVPSIREEPADSDEPAVQAVVPTIAQPRAVPTVVAVPEVQPAPELIVADSSAAEAPTPVIAPRVRTVGVPTIAQPRVVPTAVAVPEIPAALEPTVVQPSVIEPVPAVAVAQVRAVVAPRIVQPRAIEAPVDSPEVPEVVEEVLAEAPPEEPVISKPVRVAVPQVRAVSAPTVPQPRAVATPVAAAEVQESSEEPVVQAPVAQAAPRVAVPQIRAVAAPVIPQPRAVASAVPHVYAESTVAEPPTVHASAPQVRAVAVPMAQPRATATPRVQVGAVNPVEAAAVPMARVSVSKPAKDAPARSHRVKEEITSHPLKSVCIGLAVIIALMVGANYFFVDRPLVSSMKASEFSGAPVFGHLAAFVQPNAIVIHIRPTKMIIEENFTKFLTTLAHCTPTDPITNTSFSRVALTSGWTAEYSFSGDDWKQSANFADASEDERKKYLMQHLEDAAGDPVFAQSVLNEESKAEQREKLWQKFVSTFAAPPPP